MKLTPQVVDKNLVFVCVANGAGVRRHPNMIISSSTGISFKGHFQALFPDLMLEQGLCQWGARGQALAGRSAPEIVRHYYTGAKVVQLQ